MRRSACSASQITGAPKDGGFDDPEDEYDLFGYAVAGDKENGKNQQRLGP